MSPMVLIIAILLIAVIVLAGLLLLRRPGARDSYPTRLKHGLTILDKNNFC